MLSPGHCLSAFAKWLHRWAGVLLLVLFLVQVAIVVLRYVFAIGWPWVQDLLVYLFSLSVLMPGLAVLLGNTSVRVDIFYNRFRPSRKALVDRLSLLLLLLPAMAYAAWQATGFAVSSWNVFETSPTMGGLPGYYLLKTAVALFFAFLAIGALTLIFTKLPYDYSAKAHGEGH